MIKLRKNLLLKNMINQNQKKKYNGLIMKYFQKVKMN